ncbi:MAG: mechanosensitive ion channel family protein [Chloroflexi bacterium]|nr:mechanosensitive ion channel family protein [Chloroflexota bacterium]
MTIFGLDANAELVRWVTAAIILATSIVLAIISRFVLAGIMRLVEHHTKTKLDDMIIQALGRPLFAALITAGLWLALVQIPELSAHLGIVHDVGVILIMAVATVAAVRVIQALFLWYGAELASRAKLEMGSKLIPLLRRVSTIAIYAIGLLIILDQLHVNISPVLAGLGIGGLAVALALQSTLSNFLAGTYVLSDAVIHTGDYIMLDSGQEGFVEDIGWRSTKLRHWQGNLIILPNSKLADAIVTDYEKPDKAMLFTVDCGVSYESDLAKVERVTLGVAAETLRNFPQGAKDFEPVVRFKQFGDSNINFAIVLKSVDRVGQFLLKHEFIKALHKRFGEEGIEIQYPARRLYFADGRNVFLPSDAARQTKGGPGAPAGGQS